MLVPSSFLPSSASSSVSSFPIPIIKWKIPYAGLIYRIAIDFTHIRQVVAYVKGQAQTHVVKWAFPILSKQVFLKRVQHSPYAFHIIVQHKDKQMRLLITSPLFDQEAQEVFQGLNAELIARDAAQLRLHLEMYERDDQEEYQRFLLKVVKQSSSPSHNGSIAAANAITLLNHLGFVFSDLQLQNIRIPYASLVGAMCQGTNLSGADLS